MAQNTELNTFVITTLQNLIERGYSESTVKNHKDIFRGLELFCERNSFYGYNEEIGRKFIESKKMRTSSLRRYTSAIRRLDCTMNGTEWQPNRKKREPVASSCYDSIVKDFEDYLRQSEKTEETIRCIVATTARFLCFLEKEGCFRLEALEPQHLYSGFSSIDKINNKHVFKVSINAFLKYAHVYGLIKNDYSHIIPSVRRHYPVPSVYSPEEVEHMLASIDRTTEVGKRDYAVALIAARLGFRASDISNLSVQNFNMVKGTIEIVQQKTKNPLVLPLLDEVKAAVFDYIDNARPQSDDNHIFLNLHGYGYVNPSHVGRIVRVALRRAGVNCKNRKTGSHSLRASLATALLSEGNDYHTIQKVLGHLDIESTKIYVKAEVEKLRTNALPVSAPTGTFASLLMDGGVQS
jgi:site-specific recombinase XerD